MSQLIHMRQRIKTIETIKKVMGAMRMVSRSFHTRMNHSKAVFYEYKDTVKQLFTFLRIHNQTWHNALFFPSVEQQRTLYIIVGAHKGLCGTYNTEINYWITNHKELLQAPSTHTIIIGKKIVDHMDKLKISVMQQLPELKVSSLKELVKEIIAIITKAQPHYTRVIIISNHPQSFFINRMRETTVIPLENIQESDDAFRYEKSSDSLMLLDALAQAYLYDVVYNALFESLLGEHAARFITADNATRNANRFLNRMKLQYNKLRQAKITKELTELATTFN